ncbi:FAD/NAD(P)-binding protein [Sulfitobacter pacificus]|uniref:FAD/NAD(P)-binding protein n=1 Tax=Sulfitobacter pacificus TaxID=1499314 RepID=UPI00360805C8
MHSEHSHSGIGHRPAKLSGGSHPPFADWSSTPYQPDDFPPRSDLGAYLHARFKALCAAVEGRFEITHTKTAINGLTDTATGWWLEADGQQYGPYDEILLAQGQPATSPDPQRARWAAYAADHKLTLTSAYPANGLLQAARDWQGKTVAIRGLGLSTLDVVRLLTWGLGGQFEDGKYSPLVANHTGSCPFRLMACRLQPSRQRGRLMASMTLLPKKPAPSWRR